MTKRSLRHPLRPQSGCMWSLMNIFDFRQGRSTAKLLSDRKHGIGRSSSQKIIPGRTENHDKTADVEDCTADAPRASVKELMAVEMIKEVSDDPEIKLERNGSKSEKSIKKQKRRNRSRAKCSDMDAHYLDGAECSPENLNQVPEQKLLNNLDLQAAMEELVRISQRNTDVSDNNSDGAPDVEKLVAALKLVMRSREEGNAFFSEEFMDASRILSVNKGLFLKLLKDQNSALIKHFQKLVDSRADEDQKPCALPKPDELSSRKHWGFFRRNKSVESLDFDKDYLSPGRIVVLKPGRAVAQSPIRSLSLWSDDDKAHRNRNLSYFSFTNFKRKLWNAMGKERQVISPAGRTLKLSPKQQNEKGSPGWSSPNRNHFYTERFTLFSTSLKPVGKLKERSLEVPQLSRLAGSDIHIEAKKHLSNVLDNRDENAVSKDGQLSKSLGGIISFPEYNRSCHSCPRKAGNDIFITPEMRFSPLGTVKNNLSEPSQEILENHTSLRKQNLESPPCSSPDEEQSLLKDDLDCALEVQSFNNDTTASDASEVEEVTESRSQEEENIVKICSELARNSFCIDTREGDSIEVENEESASLFLQDSSLSLNSDSIGEVPISSPSAVSSHTPFDYSYHATGKTERPSPVSVLQPFFVDDDFSPASTISQPEEKDILPLHIHFEEQPSTELGICTRISPEDEESAFEYVEAVLLGSGLNWDEFLTHWLSSYDILELSLFNEVELFSSRSHHDQKLLFDCTNEALQEVCEVYFGQFSGISNNKSNIRPVPRGMDLIHETWERVESCMVRNPKNCSLEQLIETDLGISGNWMNLRLDVEAVGFIIEEAVFDELVEDFALLSFIDEVEFQPEAIVDPRL